MDGGGKAGEHGVDVPIVERRLEVEPEQIGAELRHVLARVRANTLVFLLAVALALWCAFAISLALSGIEYG